MHNHLEQPGPVWSQSAPPPPPPPPLEIAYYQHVPNLPELPRQLTVKTSSSKKRKISTRQSAKDESQHSRDSPDIPLESCEREDVDPSFSFSASSTTSTASTVVSPAYIRADSLPPASSLPPRLQTNYNSSFTDYASSTASSPSGAYAELTIDSDRGADTPGSDLYPSAPGTGTHPAARASSPFTRTTYCRAIMGGAAEFPDRASSPLKRRASSMDPEAEPDAKEDVDMIAAPPSPPTTTTTTTGATRAGSTSQGTNGASEGAQDEIMGEEPSASNGESAASQTTNPAPQPPPSIEAHIKTIRTLVEEMNASHLKVGQVGYLVSKQWLSKVLPDGRSSKGADDLSSVGPVDNSDVIWEIIRDPCVGDGVEDQLKKKFVRLKRHVDLDQVEVFPPEAWDLLVQWPGLKEGQLPIVRTAYDSSGDSARSNIVFELHPVVFTLHRLWSANSPIAIDQQLKATNPPPPRLARSRTMPYQTLLAQAKNVTNINRTQRVQVWRVEQQPPPPGGTAPTPPASPDHVHNSDKASKPFDHLLLDVELFLALEPGVREKVDMADHTNNPKYNGHMNISTLGLSTDLALVLDEHVDGTDWVSTYSPSRASASLPTRNSSASLTLQNKGSRSGGTSPAPAGPITRGRTQKSGRTLGCVGLSNLGNTCYMSAALQCVRSVEELTKYFLSQEWKKELNKDNVLAHNGDVAAAYANLLMDIYKDSNQSSITPRQFKNTIGRYAPSFSGYGQQDSQEFVGFLLDGLQEDLSRIKKKPYIEKPDSTDEMINDPGAIRKMAEQVWDITKKRDDSVIADLFTGLYKSTLVCPECGKISITFDPFNNLTLPLPIENKWNHTIKFFPLNDYPVNIRVELDRQASIKGLKEFVSVRTGVPVERLFVAEEWKNKFYKYYADLACASDEIAQNDLVWCFELEAKPTNWGAKPQKQQKLGTTIRSLVDEEEHNANVPWDDEQADRLLVPVLHRRPAPARASFHSRRWSFTCAPFFIVLTPEEARSEDAIRRKVLERIATLTKHPFFSDEPDNSDNTDAELIGANGSDFGSSSDGKVVAQSVQGEDDIVDVHMKDAVPAQSSAPGGRASQSHPARHKFNSVKPAWVNPKKFLPAKLQNLFELCYFSEGGAWLPSGQNSLNEDKDLPKLSSRAPPETASSEDQFDNVTNGTASNEESSSDETSRPSIEMPQTRMTEESDDEDNNFAVKVCPNVPNRWMAYPGSDEPLSEDFALTTSQSQPLPHRQKSSKAKPSTKIAGGRKKMKAHRVYGKGANKKLRQQQQHQRQLQKERQKTFEVDQFDTEEPVADGGPLIRLKEGIVVDWAEEAYEEVFSRDATWDGCETLPDAELDKAQQTRSKRRKNGISIEACLDEFERDEILSEQDMWYCPRCKEHRRASKKFDLWKTPDILVIHLKRFSSSGFRRDKIDVLVDFPLENLDITSRVLHREEGKQEVYDLIGVDCHWGGLGGGHYTAHAKNFVDGQWYTYNDSSVSKAQTSTIVDSSAYLLFYRRRSDVPLGGPRFREILERFHGESSDTDLPDSGEGQRLGEVSSLAGSSSAFQGEEATRLDGSRGGSNANGSYSLNRIGGRTEDDVPLQVGAQYDSTQSVHRSVEEDEGIDLGENASHSTGFHPLTGSNSWSFQYLPGPANFTAGSGSANVSDIASDEAQHDSSGDERALSHNMEYDPDVEPDLPGVSSYQLPQRPELDPPAYTEPIEPQVKYLGAMPAPERGGQWGQTQKVYEVPAVQADDERRSEEAMEIHLDESDKIKLG
ncbi:hypothetical protein DL765_005954 [Monosporascus sp. GIB2]|nr:hypothetical protein DL765_005954 [Monosporascus sp. GIB2]